MVDPCPHGVAIDVCEFDVWNGTLTPACWRRVGPLSGAQTFCLKVRPVKCRSYHTAEKKSGAQRSFLSENVTIPEVFWPATVDFCTFDVISAPFAILQTASFNGALQPKTLVTFKPEDGAERVTGAPYPPTHGGQ